MNHAAAALLALERITEALDRLDAHPHDQAEANALAAVREALSEYAEAVNAWYKVRVKLVGQWVSVAVYAESDAEAKVVRRRETPWP